MANTCVLILSLLLLLLLLLLLYLGFHDYSRLTGQQWN